MNWKEANQQTLDRTDVAAEYKRWGIDVVGREPNAAGWIECRRQGAEDRTPSAGIFAGQGAKRGTYNEFSGEGRHLTFFDAAAEFGGFADWKEARNHYAKQAGVALPTKREKTTNDHNSKIVPREWIEAIGQIFCNTKRPITTAAIRQAGGILAGWPASGERFTTVALPIFGAKGPSDPPTGWVIWNVTGQPLQLYQRNAPPRPVKMLTVAGSKSGLMGEQALAAMQQPGDETVWKCEGPGDMLALMAAIPAEQQAENLVFTNAGGATEHPRPEFLRGLAGRKAVVVMDSDEPGQIGGRRWAEAMAAHAVEVRLVKLPYEITPTHGKDLRDFLNDEHTFTDLQELAAESEIIYRTKDDAKDIDAGPEAAEFLGKTEQDGVWKLRFYRGSFCFHTRGAYIEMPLSDVRGQLIEYLDERFSKLDTRSTSNVLDCVKAKARLSHRTEPPAWIGEKPGPWPADQVLAARNALIHLPSLVEGRDFSIPPTPRFFTTTALDYDFNAHAPTPKRWEEFLFQLWPDDTQTIKTLQEIFGYCLMLDTRQQKIFLLIGPKRSGKGTIARVLRALIGNANVAGPTLASLATNFGLWPLLGKSLAIISDARLSGRTDSAIVVERLLSISGEDALTVDRKNLEPVTGKLNTRLVILTNELPRLGDASGALTSRIIALRLTKSFYGRENHNLTDNLLAELPGILLWAIEGWQRLRVRKHFTQPDSALELMGEFNDLASPISQFIRECCTIETGANVPRDTLYDRFVEWAKSKGRNHVDDAAGFGRQLRAALPNLGDTRHRIEGKLIRFYEGITLMG